MRVASARDHETCRAQQTAKTKRGGDESQLVPPATGKYHYEEDVPPTQVARLVCLFRIAYNASAI
jgi:D-arabinose 1-dehydrogenase-like Zn-dependent alcohol dehydrogenase